MKKYFFVFIVCALTQYSFAQAPTLISFSPTTAGPGDNIVITGTNFTPTSSVVIGAGTASTQYISSTKLLANIGTGAVTGGPDDVTVYDGSNVSNTLSGFIFNGTPIINSVIPSTAGAGDTIKISGKYLAPGGNFFIAPTVNLGGVTPTAVLPINRDTVLVVVGNGASGSIYLANCCFGSTTFPGFVFKQNCVVKNITAVAVCPSQLPYIWNGRKLYNSASYVDSLKGINGCDSLAILNFTVKATSASTTTISVCPSNLPFFWNGLNINSTGSYNVTLTNAAGCDSIATINLTVIPATTSTTNIHVCSSKLPFIWNVLRISANGTYNATLTSVAGCDSIAVLNFTVDTCIIPTITSISPTSGAIGTSVTITGTNFNTTAANNIVYFGAVKATVTNANATALTVVVPAGATYQPISVTVGGLTAYSTQIFDVQFTGAGLVFSKNDFSSPINATIPNSNAFAVGDLDGDGKTDIALGSYPSTLNIFRNISVGKNISFAKAMVYTTAHSGAESDNFVASVAIGDLDGDGKSDIVTCSYDTVKIFQNTSTPGNLSFVPQAVFYTGQYGVNICIADMDGDGKPDLAILNENSNSISIFTNTSAAGIISFALQGNYSTSSYPQALVVKDFDGDGKPDLAAIAYTAAFSVFKNTSANGSISFSSRKDFSIPGYLGGMSAGDLDGDGKPDIVISSFNNKVSIFKNTSSVGSINFGAQIDSTTGAAPQGISISDLDGDGKPDIVAVNSDTSKGKTVSILKNTGSPGTISFAFKVDYLAGPFPTNLCIADFDGDGKPDLNINYIVLRNQVGEPVFTPLCAPIGNTTLTSNITGTSYQWQLSTGAGFNNISNNSNYNGVNTGTLQLNNIPSLWYGYQYRCVVDSANSDAYTLKFTDTFTGTNSTWETAANWSCGTVPDSNTDVFINSGNVVLSSNTTVRSLMVSPNASFTITTPFTLTVVH